MGKETLTGGQLPACAPLSAERRDDVDNPDTLILNLTFLGTLGVAFLMAFVLFMLGVATLILAGIGRLAGLVVQLLFGRLRRQESLRFGAEAPATVTSVAEPAADPVPAPEAGPVAVLRTAVGRLSPKNNPRREPAVLSKEWTAAVEAADARAKARAGAPDIKLSVRDLPDQPLPELPTNTGPETNMKPARGNTPVAKTPTSPAKTRSSTPDIKLSVRDLPDPDEPGQTNSQGTSVPAAEAPAAEPAAAKTARTGKPRSFTKPPQPAPLSQLDTGSLASVAKGQQPRKARTPSSNQPESAGVQGKDRQHLP